MEDEDLVRLNNTCADLVSLEKYEAFPVQLLAGMRGEWVGVRELCVQVGMNPGDVNEDLFATWLSDPTGHEEYAIILFYDDESGWTMAANYNRKRLLGAAAAGGQQEVGRVSESA